MKIFKWDSLPPVTVKKKLRVRGQLVHAAAPTGLATPMLIMEAEGRHTRARKRLVLGLVSYRKLMVNWHNIHYWRSGICRELETLGTAY
jgi:hypothetical protein